MEVCSGRTGLLGNGGQCLLSANYEFDGALYCHVHKPRHASRRPSNTASIGCEVPVPVYKAIRTTSERTGKTYAEIIREGVYMVLAKYEAELADEPEGGR